MPGNLCAICRRFPLIRGSALLFFANSCYLTTIDIGTSVLHHHGVLLIVPFHGKKIILVNGEADPFQVVNGFD